MVDFLEVIREASVTVSSKLSRQYLSVQFRSPPAGHSYCFLPLLSLSFTICSVLFEFINLILSTTLRDLRESQNNVSIICN